MDTELTEEEIKRREEKERKHKKYSKKIDNIEHMSIKEFMAKILSIPNATYRAIYDVAFLTGARVTEVCTLRKEDVEFDGINKRITFTMITEKRKNDKHKIKTVPISAAHNQEFIDTMNDFLSYWKHRQIDKLDDSAYIFGDPGFYKVVKKYEVRDKTSQDPLKKTWVTKVYIDNHMRHRIATFCEHHADLNPHLLRHKRIRYIATADKEEYKKYDRLFLIKNLVNFSRLESAQKYTGEMDPNQKEEVF
jgi:integrase